MLTMLKRITDPIVGIYVVPGKHFHALVKIRKSGEREEAIKEYIYTYTSSFTLI